MSGSGIQCSVFGIRCFRVPRSAFRVPLALCALLFAPALLLAEKQIDISLRLDEKEILVGVSTFAQVLVVGGYPDEVPEELSAPGLKIAKVPGGVSFRDQFRDGKKLASAQILYSVTGETAGDFMLPSFVVKLGGQSFGTAPQPIRILAPGKGDEGLQANRPLFLKFRAAKTEAYVNELVGIELLLYAKGDDSISKSSAPEFQGLEHFLVQRFPLSYTPSALTIEGLPFTSMKFPTFVAGLAEGRHVLGPARLTVGIRRTASPVYPPGMPGDTEERTVASNELEFVIKPLPAAGRPAMFQGAVGQFELEVSAAPVRLRAGDPLDVTIKIRGKGNFDNLSAPSLAETAEWRTYPVVRRDTERQSGLEQTASFSQVAIPLQQVKELPAIEFAFFDPAEEKYVIGRSKPVPLQVESAQSPAESSAGTGLARWGMSPAQLDDILFIRGELKSVRPLTAATTMGTGFWLVQGLFLLVFLGIVGFGIRERARKHRQARLNSDEVTITEVQSAFSQQNLSWADYYRLVFGYLDAAREPGVQWPSKLSQENRVVLDQVTRAGEATLYSGQMNSERGAVPRREKAQTLQALREWERSRK